MPIVMEPCRSSRSSRSTHERGSSTGLASRCGGGILRKPSFRSVFGLLGSLGRALGRWCRRVASIRGLARLGQVLLGWAVAARLAYAEDRIQEVQLGFQDVAKAGAWAPVRVQVQADGDGFQGYLVTRTTDADDVPNEYGLADLGDPGSGLAVSLPPNTTRWFLTYARPGTLAAEVQVRLTDPQARDTGVGMAISSAVLVPHTHLLLLQLGFTMDLRREELQAASESETSARSGPVELEVAGVELDGEVLPNRWLGYDGIDAVFLPLEHPDLGRLSLEQQRALADWVYRGGFLVVSAGRDIAHLADSPLAGLLPASPEGSLTVPDLAELEEFTRTPHRFPIPPTGLSIARLQRRDGSVLVSKKDLPLVVQGRHGFGTVTVVAVPLSSPVFRQWPGRHTLIAKLLSAHAWQSRGEERQYRAEVRNDLSTTAKEWVERFRGVRGISFPWIALLIFLYIAVIGPADYFFVKKVLKRPELTWLTFSLLVVVVSVVTYWLVVALKGRDLRVKELSIVDVDMRTAQSRLLLVTSVFSPRALVFDVEVPQSPWTQAAHGAGGGVLLSWFGVPEAGLGGFDRAGGYRVLLKAYLHGGRGRTLREVPVRAWSAKTFAAEAIGISPARMTTSLSSTLGGHLSGTIENQTGTHFDRAAVVYGRRAYLLGEVSDGAFLRVQDFELVSLSSLPVALAKEIQKISPTESDLVEALTWMSFYRALAQYCPVTNCGWDRYDLTTLWQQEDTAIFLGWSAGPGPVSLEVLQGTETLDGAPEGTSFWRLILPVQHGTAVGSLGNRAP
jgi:hypothetical protein